MRYPAVPLLVAFAAGIVLPLSSAPGLFVALAVCGLTWAFRNRNRRRLGLCSLAVAAAFVCLGKAAIDVRRRVAERRDLPVLYRRLGERAFVMPARLAATLRSEPRAGIDVTELTLDVSAIRYGGDDVPMRGGVRARVGGELRARLDELVAGDRIQVWGWLRPARAFLNPGSFDVESHLERNDVDLYLSVKSALLVELVDKASWRRSSISRLRVGARRKLERAFDGDNETLGVVLALVNGDRSRLPEETVSLYQRSGIFHVMAISGAHVAMLALFLHGMMRRLSFGEVSVLVTLLVALPLYAAFCGGRSPAVRAVVMASLVIGARLLSLDRPRANALALGGLLLLVWDPLSLTDAGFQLSFAAMSAIVLLAEPLSRRLARLGLLAVPLSVSLAAQLGVTPFAAWHFHRLNPLAPIASLFAMPLAGVLVVLGLALAVLPQVAWLTALLAALARAGVFVLDRIAEAISSFEVASIPVSRPGGLASLLFAAGFTSLALTRHSRYPRHWAAIGTVLVGGALISILSGSPAGGGTLTLTALDVGHGDALFMVLPEGQRMLVDGGGSFGSSFDIGASVVLPFLMEVGVRKLDTVVMTHAHLDHVGGLFSVIDALPVGTIWEGTPRWHAPVYRALRRRAERRGVPFRRLSAGETFDYGGARFEILAAGALAETEIENENDRSLVMRVSFAGRRILLTGDAERATERALLRNGAALDADIIKVGHHGSRSSSTPAFLAAVDPKLAVVSARARAAWPLPSASVLHRLRTMGVEILETDWEGAVTISIDASGGMAVSTHRARRRR